MEVNQLAEYFSIHLQKKDNALVSLAGTEAQHTGNMNALLEAYAPLIKAREPKAAAAYFGSWISSLALCLQYALSMENKAPDLALSNLTIQLYREGGQHDWSFAFVVEEWKEGNGPSGEAERASWREETLSRFYAETMRPLLEAAAQAGGHEVGQLWGQLPTKFNYYLEHFSDAAPSCAIRHRIAADYDYLRGELSPAVFGRKKNPFDVKIRYIPDWRDDSKQVRQKNVCCLYYLTGDGQYCYTCPRMKESERAIRAEEMRSSQANR
ncbi:Fe-S oxidoreductase [Brevibacillus fluminis]|uniref:Fe-S oxidoreductase n=1 Tax=Brevibacillus fluminis TaxID=511487 RepID=UPI003F8A1F12